MLKGPFASPYWNYVMGPLDEKIEENARSFFGSCPHVCLLDACDKKSPQYIKHTYGYFQRLVEIFGVLDSIIMPLSTCQLDMRPVVTEEMLDHWVTIAACEPDFEQDKDELFKVYALFFKNAPQPGLLLGYNEKNEPVGAISGHFNEKGTLLSIFTLAAVKGDPCIKKTLVNACVCLSRNSNGKNAKVVYLGTKDEYDTIFQPMEFIIAREVDLYKAQEEKKEIVHEQK
jgi:hypothetical protein